MKSVLLTGGTGFVGSQAAAPLLARGFEVHAVSRRPPGERSEGVRWHRADLLDRAQVERLLDEVRPGFLLHFAWRVDHGKFWSAPENLDWVGASLFLARQFVRCGGTRMVMAGSCAEYDWGAGHCAERETSLGPSTLYGVCKNGLRSMVESFSARENVRFAWGRLFHLYGPNEHPDRLVPSVIRALLAGKPALCTRGEQVRDFLHVADAAEAFVALLDSGVTGPVNVVSGRPVSIREMVFAIADRLGGRERVRLGAVPLPEGDPPVLTGATDRLYNEVGWRPRTELDEGIRRTVAWWKERKRRGTAE